MTFVFLEKKEENQQKWGRFHFIEITTHTFSFLQPDKGQQSVNNGKCEQIISINVKWVKWTRRKKSAKTGKLVGGVFGVHVCECEFYARKRKVLKVMRHIIFTISLFIFVWIVFFPVFSTLVYASLRTLHRAHHLFCISELIHAS